MGDTSNGHLIRGVRLPRRGPHHAVLPGYWSRGTSWGTQDLIRLILDSARQVARRHPGARLMVGNLSRRQGGDLPWSVSHNAGRDADLAFFLRRRGRPVAAPCLVRIGPRLRSLRPRGYRLDVVRTWALVAALLSHPKVRVQWIFVANFIRAALLHYARRHGTPASLLTRAEQVLKQPSDSLSHDDHLHVRIYCSRTDRLHGCRDRPPFWPGVPRWQSAVAQHVRLLLPGLGDRSPAVRRAVLARLSLLEARDTAPAVSRLLLRDPELRMAALALLRRWKASHPTVLANLERFLWRQGPGVATPRRRPGSGRVRRPGRRRRGRLRRGADRHRTAAQVRAAYRFLADLPGAAPLALLARGIRSRRRLRSARGRWLEPEALLAIRASRGRAGRTVVGALMAALGGPYRRVQAAALAQLRRLTNQRFSARGLPRSPRKVRRLVARWRAWWHRNRSQSRLQWVVQGFRRWRGQRRGFDPRRWRDLRWLVALTRHGGDRGNAAHWLLGRLSGQSGARARQARGLALRHRLWRRWLARRRPRRPRRRRRLSRRRPGRPRHRQPLALRRRNGRMRQGQALRGRRAFSPQALR